MPSKAQPKNVSREATSLDKKNSKSSAAMSVAKGIISAIEIAYFRSFYKIYFDNINSLNIFFGENDTGKSNVMRALNLFFNNIVDPGYEFDFDIDLSTKRLAESQGENDVRKFLYVKIWFRTPSEHRKALGDEFYVKRTWSQSTIPGYRQEVSRHIDTSGKQQSLTKLLNKVAFTYIPAIKSHDVYSGLLEESYKAIANSENFSKALQAFTDEIRNQTSELSKGLNRSLGMSSDLAPPTDLAELFGTLDFQTLASGGDKMSLLRQRGDGVQARHIPEIMSFISEKDSHQYHVWGIEEPENSLSINSSILLAERLKDITQNGHIQLFLTTHSPSFYSLNGTGVRKAFLKNSENDVQTLDGTSMGTQELMEFMGDRFYLPLVAKGVQEAVEKADFLERNVRELERQIQQRDRPILFVEGQSEEILVNHILKSRNIIDKIDVVPLGSASHAERFATMTEELVTRILNGRKGYVLLDSDQAGLSALPKQIDKQSTKQRWIQSGNKIKWRTIPVSKEASRAFQAAGINDTQKHTACLEDCYPADLRSKAMDSGSYAIGDPKPAARQGDLFIISDALKENSHKFYLNSANESYKMKFVKWLIENNLHESDTLNDVFIDIFEEV